jgi:hypothetical protein
MKMPPRGKDMIGSRRELIQRRLACRHALAIPDLPQDIAEGFKQLSRHAGERLVSADPIRVRFACEWAAKWRLLALSARTAESRDACLQIAAAWERETLEMPEGEAAA